jgi:hypothetical protein
MSSRIGRVRSIGTRVRHPADDEAGCDKNFVHLAAFRNYARSA